MGFSPWGKPARRLRADPDTFDLCRGIQWRAGGEDGVQLSLGPPGEGDAIEKMIGTFGV